MSLHGKYGKAFNLGYEDAANGATLLACPWGCVVGEFGLRTAWIAGYHQWHDEQEGRHANAA